MRKREEDRRDGGESEGGRRGRDKPGERDRLAGKKIKGGRDGGGGIEGEGLQGTTLMSAPPPKQK